MAGFLGELGGITAGVGAEGLAFAAGFAASHALEPEAVTIRQDAWNAARVLRIPPEVAAAIAAENISKFDDMQTEANYSGWDDTRFPLLYHLNLTAPGTGELITMLRRNSEVSIDFTHGLRKNKLETQWDAALANLADQRLSAADIAYMIVRGVLPDDGMLGMTLPTQPDNLQLPPQLNLDPVTEASLTGWDKLRLRAMIARSGLAMAPVMAAQANFRTHAKTAYDNLPPIQGIDSLGLKTILTDNDYLLTIGRGDLFPAYADPVRDASRQILTAGEYAELQLRGWLTKDQRDALIAQHGMSPGNGDLLYRLMRRPLSPHQIKQAQARGASFNPEPGEIQDPYTASVHQANLGPEWYEMAVSLQGSYPSVFVTNRLVTSGIVTPDDGQLWLQRSGLADVVVDALHKSWTSSSSGAADKDVASAATKLKTRTHSSYVAAEIDDAAATAALQAAGVAAAAIPAVLNLWKAERGLIRKQLSPTQIRKAVSAGVVNPATGVAWTLAEGIAALLARGYDQADAETLLAE